MGTIKIRLETDIREELVRHLAKDVGAKLNEEVVRYIAQSKVKTVTQLRRFVLRVKMASLIQRRPASVHMAKMWEKL